MNQFRYRTFSPLPEPPMSDEALRRSDVARILRTAIESDEETWRARFSIWPPNCSRDALSFQVCLGRDIPMELHGWTLADKLEMQVARTGIESHGEAVQLAREAWSRWIESDEVQHRLRSKEPA